MVCWGRAAGTGTAGPARPARGARAVIPGNGRPTSRACVLNDRLMNYDKFVLKPLPG